MTIANTDSELSIAIESRTQASSKLLRSEATGQPHDPGLWAPLTGDEQMIVRHHLASGWYKIPAVHGHLTGLWWEICDLLTDLHLEWQIESAQAPALAVAMARGQVIA